MLVTPPRCLTANRTQQGVLLSWLPPANHSFPIDRYIMEFRVAERWEILDDGIPGTENEFFAKDLSQVSRGCAVCRSSGEAFGTVWDLCWGLQGAGPGWRDLTAVLGVSGHLVRVPGPGGHAGSHQRTQQRCWRLQYR